MEEVEESKDEGKQKEASGNVELLVHVQELEDKLKNSEQKMSELIHNNTALEIKLKATQQENDDIRQEMVSLNENNLSVLSSQVRRMVILRHQDRPSQECFV